MKKKVSEIGMVCSAFDLLHAGHMLMLKDAKAHCDYLIIGLQVDPSVTPASYRGKKKNKPVMTLKERRIMLEGIKYIDEVFVYTTEADLLANLKKHKHTIRILGSDWEGRIATGQNLAKTVYYHKRSYPYSTSELRQRVYKDEVKKLEVK